MRATKAEVQKQVAWLKQQHPDEWLRTYEQVNQEESDRNGWICRYCGGLATGFHERTCRRYLEAVRRITLGRLRLLLPAELRIK